MKKAKILPKATAALSKEVEEELKIKDPSPEVAKAAMRCNKRCACENPSENKCE